MCAYQPGFETKKMSTMLLRVFAVFVVSRHEVFVQFRLCPLLAHDEDRDIGGDVRHASGEPRDILQDVDDVTTVRILPSLEAVDAHDGGDFGDEDLLNLRHFLQLWGYVSRVHVGVGGEDFGVLLGIESQKCAASCNTGTVAQLLSMYILVLQPSRSEFKSLCAFCFVFEKGMFPFTYLFPLTPPLPPPETPTFQNPTVRRRWAHTCYTRQKYCCTPAVGLVQGVLGYGSNACLHHSKTT